jgi:hypothetical protein
MFSEPVLHCVSLQNTGAISDSSTSKYRRRFWISLSTCFLVIALTTLAYCEPWARFVVDLVGSGGGDWDPKRAEQVYNAVIMDIERCGTDLLLRLPTWPLYSPSLRYTFSTLL